jgi:tetratricopeptide (TPR) repeat protein
VTLKPFILNRIRTGTFAFAVIASVLNTSCGTSATGSSSTKILLDEAANRKLAGDPAACIADYTQVLRAEPGLVKAYEGRAGCFLDQGNASAAVQDYTQAIRLSGVDPALYLDRGWANQLIGNNSMAAADYRKVSELGSANPDQLHRAAGGLLNIQFYADAKTFVDRAINAYSAYWPLYVDRAKAADALGDTASATKAFDEAVQLASGRDLADALGARGSFFLNRQQYDLASKDFNRAIGIDSHNWLAFEGRAVARLAKADLRGAESDFGSAIAVFNQLQSSDTWTSARLYEERGKVYFAEGMRDAALRDFRQALSTLSASGPADWRARLMSEISSSGG